MLHSLELVLITVINNNGIARNTSEIIASIEFKHTSVSQYAIWLCS